MSFPGLGKLGQIALTVDDVEAATAFYRDTLGLLFLFSAPPQLAFFNLHGVRLMLTAPEGGSRPGGGSVLYFDVDDIEEAYAALRDRGVSFAGEPHRIATLPQGELWMAFFHDPSGNMLALMTTKP